MMLAHENLEFSIFQTTSKTISTIAFRLGTYNRAFLCAFDIRFPPSVMSVDSLCSSNLYHHIDVHNLSPTHSRK